MEPKHVKMEPMGSAKLLLMMIYDIFGDEVSVQVLSYISQLHILEY